MKSQKWYESLRRECKIGNCKKGMKIANIEKVLGFEEAWPFFRCKGPHPGRLLEYEEAL